MTGASPLAPADRYSRRAAGAVVLLACLLFWAAALYGIKSPFYYGHYGYHGGSYASWARGTLRHHTLLPVNEPGFAPPAPGSYYIHHPVLSTQLVTLAFIVLGEHEWSIRLAALATAFLSLLLVTALAWRKLGPWGGATAALVFAVVPVNIWYGVNMDPGFPSIACLLAFFWFYFRWLETGRWAFGAAALATQALAGGFEWSPYLAFPIIFLHVAWTGWRRRGRFLHFALLHPLVVLVPLATHFFIVWRAGMMADLMGAYQNRAAPVTYKHFAAVMLQYGETLFGRPLLAAMLLWLVVTVARVLLRRGRAFDLVGLTFAFTLVVYVHVFKVAVITHAYRLMYGNVWAALAVADLIWLLGRLLRWMVVTYWTSAPVGRARSVGVGAGALLGCAIGATILVGTAPLAWAGLLESRAHGGIPGWKTFNPDLRQTAFAHQVNLATRPGDILYFHPSFPGPPPYRMDWAFYYDRDLKRGALLRMVQTLPAPARARALAIFLPGNLTGEERRAYAELAQQHPTLMIDDLALLDLRTKGARTEVYSVPPPVALGWPTPAPATSAAGRPAPGKATPAKPLSPAPAKQAPSIAQPRSTAATVGAVTRWLQGPYPMPRLIREPTRQAAEEQVMKAILATPPPRAALPPPAATAAAAARKRAGPKETPFQYRRGEASAAFEASRQKEQRRKGQTTQTR